MNLKNFFLVCVAALLPSVAMAQEASTEFQLEQFEPQAAQGINMLNLARSQPLAHLTPSAGLFLHFAKDPLVLRELGSDETESVVGNQLKAEILLGLGLFDIVDIGLAVPLVMFQDGGDLGQFGRTGASIDSFALSDIRLTPKIRLIDPEWAAGFGAALLVPVYIPVGDTDSFNSDGAIRAEPRLALDWAHDSGLAVVANAGFQLRPKREARNFVSGNVVKWGAGLQIPVGWEPMKVVSSVFGTIPMEDAQQLGSVSLDELERGNPIEAVGGLQFQLPADLIAQVGAGTGLNAAVGSPALRLFASLSYTPFGEKDVDTDGDGLLDSVDQCPTEPEDFDQFEDEDGCPDPDNDGDNILDVDDSCPNEAGIPELQGCPPVDTDGDGFQDHVDKCPNEPGIEELEGCPAVDTDGDGIFDHKDKCPNEPGIEELEGCPAVDADGDGIPDHKDKCPDEPGLPELEGCPKDGPKVVVTETEIRISETIYFDTGKATIQARSFNLLDTVAFVLKRHSKITGVRIEGHTDDVGKDASNLELSKARAKSVRDYLVSKGIDEARLSSEGYGESQPKADIKGLRGKDLREARALNRRVEFRITEIDGKNVEASDSVIIKEETTVEE